MFPLCDNTCSDCFGKVGGCKKRENKPHETFVVFLNKTSMRQICVQSQHPGGTKARSTQGWASKCLVLTFPQIQGCDNESDYEEASAERTDAFTSPNSTFSPKRCFSPARGGAPPETGRIQLRQLQFFRRSPHILDDRNLSAQQPFTGRCTIQFAASATKWSSASNRHRFQTNCHKPVVSPATAPKWFVVDLDST